MCKMNTFIVFFGGGMRGGGGGSVCLPTDKQKESQMQLGTLCRADWLTGSE